MASSSAPVPVPQKKEDKEFTPGDVTERDDEGTLEEEEKLDQGDVKVRGPCSNRAACHRARTR